MAQAGHDAQDSHGTFILSRMSTSRQQSAKSQSTLLLTTFDAYDFESHPSIPDTTPCTDLELNELSNTCIHVCITSINRWSN